MCIQAVLREQSKSDAFETESQTGRASDTAIVQLDSECRAEMLLMVIEGSHGCAITRGNWDENFEFQAFAALAVS